jgi:diguanylate cyclase
MVNQNRDAVNNRELERLVLLKDVDLESVQGLLEDCRMQELKPDDVLIHTGQPNRFLYLVLSGRLRIHLELDLDPIVVLDPGEVVGDISMIDGQPASAYVVAHEECRVLTLDEKTLWSLVDSSPKVALNLLFVLAQRLRHGNALVLTNQRIQSEYERHAVIDALTGLHNRRWLEKILDQHLGESKKDGKRLSLLLIDIDDFERYEGIYGKTASDRVLYTVSGILRESACVGQVMARCDNDFVVLLPGSDVVAGREIGKQVRQAINEAKIYSSDGNPLSPVTVSVAVVEMTPADTPETFIRTAEEALSRIRKSGDNRVATAEREVRQGKVVVSEVNTVAEPKA